MPPDATPKFTLCCVVDADPRFYVEAVLWVLCVTRLLPTARFKPIVYVVGAVPRDLVKWIEINHVEVRQATELIEGSPHCNKLIPFFEVHYSEFTVATDVDLFFVSDPSDLFRSNRVRAAPNNHANPPAQVFRDILAASSLGCAYRPGFALIKNGNTRETHINNISAGIVAAPAAQSQTLAESWKKWAEWLTTKRDLLGQYSGHIDQVAFALAMEELGQDVEFLPPQVNTILHILPEIDTLYALHLTTGHIPDFADRFSADRQLLAEGLSDAVAAAIERLNFVIRLAVKVIEVLPATRDHFDKFLNPGWRR